ncbi:MAG TPA: carboxypeptidase-like regulatory domain-containing protein [Bacteroidota bacterium]|nr:carboxypeptidase-like regulatory domain-containing protein [Bacteroidota bacterium]
MNLLVVCLSLTLFCPSDPQTARGIVRGTVTAQATGERIVNAEVTLSPPTYVTHSDTNGTYRITNIPDGMYNLSISAPGYARLTFRGLIVPFFSPLVIDARLRDAASSRDSVIVVKFDASAMGRSQLVDKMMFYQPDSTIDYKIRIVDPTRKTAGPWPDSMKPGRK